MPAKSSIPALVITRPGSKEEVPIDFASLRKVALVLRAVNHPLRRHMINLMGEKKKITVTELHTRLNIEQSVASQHLAILRRARITNTLREGKFIHYSIDHKRLEQIERLVDELAA